MICFMHRKKKNIADLTLISVDDYRNKGKLPLVFAADSIRSLHNVGSIFRTADAFLFSEILLCGISGVPPHPELHKTALGAEDSVKWRYENDIISTLIRMKDEGWTICVLEQVHESVPLDKFVPQRDKKYVIVAGNEVDGVNPEVVDIADIVLEIPQSGTKHSLNVSVSSGIAMWHFYSYLI